MCHLRPAPTRDRGYPPATGVYPGTSRAGTWYRAGSVARFTSVIGIRPGEFRWAQAVPDEVRERTWGLDGRPNALFPTLHAGYAAIPSDQALFGTWMDTECAAIRPVGLARNFCHFLAPHRAGLSRLGSQNGYV
jgi:hypothetical protein